MFRHDISAIIRDSYKQLTYLLRGLPVESTYAVAKYVEDLLTSAVYKNK